MHVQEVCDDKGTVIFRGVRVRMAIHTGTVSNFRVGPVNVQAARAFVFQYVALSAAPLPVCMMPSHFCMWALCSATASPAACVHHIWQPSVATGLLLISSLRLCYIDSPLLMNLSHRLLHKLCCLSNTQVQTNQNCSLHSR